MPTFAYKVKTGPQEVLDGTVDAESRAAAVSRLRAMGYHPISVETASPEDGTGQRGRIDLDFLRRIRPKDVTLFFQQLANMMTAGLPLLRSLNNLASQCENPKMKSVIEDLGAQVQKGATFADSIGRHPSAFPSMYSNMIMAGETGGALEEVLERLADYGEKQDELRGKVWGALPYPILLLVVGIGSIFILLSFVFPKILGLFEDFNIQLPLPTRIVMAVSDFMGSYWWLVLFLMGAFIYAVFHYVRTEEGRLQLDTLLLRIPMVRSLVTKMEVSRFSRTLGTLVDNGVAILQSLQIVSETVGNRIISSEVLQIRERISDGASLNEAMEKTETFPDMVISMMSVGEESGSLGEVCKKVADIYDREVDRAVKTLTSLLEPTLILIMGFFVGFLVIALLLPIFMLSTSVQ